MPNRGEVSRKDEWGLARAAPQDSLIRRAYRLWAMEPQDHPPDAPTNPVARPVVAGKPAPEYAQPQSSDERYNQPPYDQPHYGAPQAPPPPLHPGDQPLPPNLSPRGKPETAR